MSLTVSLHAPTRAETVNVARWRADAGGAPFRTSREISATQQERFYEDVVDQPGAHRYWTVRPRPGYGFVPADPVAFVGLTGIEWENGLAEISLIVAPHVQRRGVGTATVRAVLDEAFLRLRLATVWGECYRCNPAYPFWERVTKAWGAYATTLPGRKYWAGALWGSLYFSFDRRHA